MLILRNEESHASDMTFEVIFKQYYVYTVKQIIWIVKVPTRVIVHRLTKEQQKKRLQDKAVREKKKRMKYSPRSKRLSDINVIPLQIFSR